MKNGQYCWDPKKLSLAHSNCRFVIYSVNRVIHTEPLRERVRRSMENGLDRILVDNTNMKECENNFHNFN
jgi:hypothetical protein